MLASSLDAPRTVMRFPLFSSYSRHCGSLHAKSARLQLNAALFTTLRLHTKFHKFDGIITNLETPDTDAQYRCRHVQAHLPPQVPLPELAVRCAAGHGAQQEGVDLDDLLHRL